ncbi:MAG: hypothetical protein NWP69_00780, partial [Congregibacter sp.]|nr:hypothetical protein [Congregibacter sp.]
ELKPSYADAYASYSTLFYLKGNVDEALTQMRKAIELDPQENRYQTQLAQALWSVSRSEEAIATVKGAIERNPKVPSNYSMLGRWYMQLGDIGKGAYWENQAGLLDGADSRPANWGRCLNLVQFWATERALECVNNFLRKYPQDTEATNYLALLTGDVELGVEGLRKSVAENPRFWYRRFQLADWLVQAKEYAEVIEVLQPVAPDLFAPQIKVSDFTIWAAINAGRAYQGLGETEKAQTLLEAGLDFIDRRRKLQGSGYIAGVEDVQILLLLDRPDEALDRLGSAVASGWRFYSYILTQSIFDPVRDDARFQSAYATVEKSLSKQLAWYDENRDMPMESMSL